MNEPTRRTVAIIGASADRGKFGNRAVRAYRAAGWIVYPVNPHAKDIEGLRAFPDVESIPGQLDRVSIYLQPDTTRSVLAGIARRGAGEVFLNPGSEDAAVLAAARALGLPVILACSILEIGKDPASPD
jgi:hypothetical protein